VHLLLLLLAELLLVQRCGNRLHQVILLPLRHRRLIL
jgi:hypothetical protein